MAGTAALKEPEQIVDEVSALRVVQSADFRQHIGRISRHSSVYFSGRMFALAAGYFFKIYLTRELGAEALGTYALGLTIIGSLGIFNAFGLSRSATRFVSAYRATGQYGLLRGLLVRSILMLVLTNLLFIPILLLAGPAIAVRFYHAPALSGYLWIFAALMCFGTFNTFFSRVLAGYKEVARSTVLTTFLGTPLMMLCTVAFVAMGWGLRGYLIAQASADGVVFLLLVATVWKLTPRKTRSHTGPLPALERRVISFSATVLLMELLGFLIMHTDKIFLGFYLNPRQVGIYALAAGMAALVPVVLQSVNQIFSPIISDLHARNEYQMLGRMFQTLTKWILGLTFPLAATMIVFSRPLMRIFGPEFEAGWSVLVVGTAGQLVNCAVGSAGSLLLMSGNEKHLLKIQAVTAAVTIVLDLTLIHPFGILGAAVAAAATNVLVNVWYLKGAYNQLHLLPYNRSYVRLVPAFLAAALCLYLVMRFASAQPKWMELGLGGFLTYAVFIGMALVSGLDADDRLITTAIWSRARNLLYPAEANG
ncbi:MAG TPA: flippase [Terriglobales bacterium]|nr:flippase [Terriglobales bacterium]